MRNKIFFFSLSFVDFIVIGSTLFSILSNFLR